MGDGAVQDVSTAGPCPGDRTPDARPTPPRSGRKRPYRRSGFYALKASVRALRPRVIDRRTGLGKQLAAWRADLVRDLGGDVSTQQAAVVFDRCSLTLKEQTRATLRRTTDYTAVQQAASAPTLVPMDRRTGVCS